MDGYGTDMRQWRTNGVCVFFVYGVPTVHYGVQLLHTYHEFEVEEKRLLNHHHHFSRRA